jgi:hypothetical protein
MINITSITLLVPLNLSNPTHQGTMEMCKDCTGCRNTLVSQKYYGIINVLFWLTEILWDYKFWLDSQDVGKLRCQIA